MARLSVVVPAHNEEHFIRKCLESIRLASRHVQAEVETVVVLNRCRDGTEAIAREFGAKIVVENAKNLAKIRNAGVWATTGDMVATMDADSWMSESMLAEIQKRLASGKTIGGGVLMFPERISLGIIASGLYIIPLLLAHPVSAGLFWCYRKDFETMGGFNESLVSVEDVDFAERLRALGKRQGRRFSTIFNAWIKTSCRKFDQFGDWHLLLHPKLAWRIYSGHDQDAADHYYYETGR
jgi:glycosyltransferase involved in cell wall biosynthesis